MAAYIDKIKDYLNNIIYPITVTSAVYDGETNARLSDMLAEKYSPDNPPPYSDISVDGIRGDSSTGEITINAVKYNTQSLTDAQKKIARDNIGAVDANYVTNNGGKIDKIQVNGRDQTITDKTVNLQMVASDVGAVAVSDVTDVLGDSKTKVPSEFAVLQAMNAAGYGDMLKSIFATNSESASGWVDKALQAKTDSNGDVIADTYVRLVISNSQPAQQYVGDLWYEITT